MTEQTQKVAAPVASTENAPLIVSKEKLLEAGAYFGHKTSLRNPNMKPYIHMAKFGTHIIDLVKTTKALEFAYNIINKAAAKNASFIFVGTKKQAKAIVEEQAKRTNSFYVSERWLGGTITNHDEIFKRVRVLERLEELEASNYAGYTKKEGVEKSKELAKLRINLTGIRTMKFMPHIMIVADPLENMNAIREAKAKGIKIIGIADTNFDPTLLDIAIPANDDSVKSISLIVTILADAIATAQGQKAAFAFQPDDAIKFAVDNDRPTRPARVNSPRGEKPNFQRKERTSAPRREFKERG